MIFDTHSHCYWDSLAPQIEDIVLRMKEHEITHAVQIGCDNVSSQKAIDLARRFPGVFYATVGIHPETSQNMTFSEIDFMMNELEELYLENKEYVKAIGECGLDHHYLSPDPEIVRKQKESQKYALMKQGSLARKYGFPVVIHTRDARSDTLEYLKEANITFAVMHCYSEDYALSQELLAYSPDIYFSFSGILTYKNASEIQDAASRIPLDRILIETDAPFLSPQPVRGSVNEPTNTRFVLDKLIELREEGRETIEETLYRNSKRFYSVT